jgi:hypothetical protein
MKSILILALSSVIALTGCSADAGVHIGEFEGGTVPVATRGTSNQTATITPHDQPKQGTLLSSTELPSN